MFNGRYGMDRLNMALLIASLVLSVLSMPFRNYNVVYMVTSGLSTALIIIGIVRMFSKNFYARQAELAKYLVLENRLKGFWTRVRAKFAGMRNGAARPKGAQKVVDINDRKNFKYLRCPQCMQKLRVPKGKGRLKVTCSKCGARFDAKS